MTATNGRAAGAVAAGVVGAMALTLVHEVARTQLREAPRIDRVGKRGMRRLAAALGLRSAGRSLYGETLAAEMVSNGLYYGALFAGRPRRPVLRGALGGLVAGLGALLLPEKLGLGRPVPHGGSAGKVMAVLWYVAGGLAAAGTFSWLSCRQESNLVNAD